MTAELIHAGLTRDEMARRAARDIPDGAYVNLGIGIPELVAAHIPPGREVIYHTENGVMGFGPPPPEGEEDPELINAGKKPITLLPGASFFHHADSFAMIRGGHIDFCILGAMQVARNGDLANWSTGAPGAIPAVGGAMDLVAGAGRIVVITEHCAKDGSPKLVDACTYPLTGRGVVARVFTDLAVVDVTSEGFVLREIAPGVDLDTVRRLTGAPLLAAAGIKTIEP
jgi:3-oxoadipate CoA-transferase, beta subunit